MKRARSRTRERREGEEEPGERTEKRLNGCNLSCLACSRSSSGPVYSVMSVPASNGLVAYKPNPVVQCRSAKSAVSSRPQQLREPVSVEHSATLHSTALLFDFPQHSTSFPVSNKHQRNVHTHTHTHTHTHSHTHSHTYTHTHTHKHTRGHLHGESSTAR